MPTPNNSPAESPITLMSVPPEIRKEIFTIMFEEANVIRIKIIKRKNGSREIARQDHNRRWNHRGEMYDPKTRKWLLAPGIASVLRASRQLYQEGSQTLYACNRFSFDTTGTLCEFLEAIGDKRASLRHIVIEVAGYKPRKACKAFELLKSAKSLRHIEVNHANICGDDVSYDNATKGRPTSEVVKHAKDLLSILMRSYEAQNLNFDVRDVLKISMQPCNRRDFDADFWRVHPSVTHHREMARDPERAGLHYSYRMCNCLCRDAEERNDRLAAEMKQEVVKQLRLDRPARQALNARDVTK